MCSTPDTRIALIGQAIDELAEETRSGPRRAGEPGAGPESNPHGVGQRLATIWAMIAELDPGLAERLPRYADPTD